jgi:CrcB-like protein, Camphor Resistance (CrcB)
MYKLVLIALGGLVGTLSRYALSTWVDERALSLIPYGTIVVNLAGCFVAGFLFPLMEKFAVAPELRLAVFTGFLGGFTTFSVQIPPGFRSRLETSPSTRTRPKSKDDVFLKTSRADLPRFRRRLGKFLSVNSASRYFSSARRKILSKRLLGPQVLMHPRSFRSLRICCVARTEFS